MSRLLSTALLATVATAQLTTSIWMPGAAHPNQSFVGSVISQQSDRTTLSLAFDGDGIETEYYANGPQTVTVGGTTYIAYEASATDEEAGFAVTVELACNRENGDAVPTCTATTRGDSMGTSINISDLPGQQATTTLSGDEQYFLNTFQLVITAGIEKLSASAAATPTGSAAQSTGTQSTGTQSTAESAASSTGSSEAVQATGAAASVGSMAPVLAGLGAAAAFFV
ncbi:hypothetical protein OPT61_g2672 [Boeremia exigua]|uniref:Uncharacterized protein n=1 Tax=Boeremia exigua TaxID=749465 RepID=A0ACC2IKU4_9PLEO|nr:hypothetical protein OPT61_g2672 [Boeremia exigua]